MNEFKILEKVNKIKEEKKIKRNVLLNCFKAFMVGGFICFLSQSLYLIFMKYFDKELSVNYTMFSLIVASSILTCFGIYDRIGQFSGCGTIIPITGFANSMTSSAMEYKSEGLVLGVLSNVFKLAGSVIVTAIVSGVVIGLIKFIGGVLIG